MSRTPTNRRLNTVTDEATAWDHLVGDEEFVLGRTVTVYRYRAVCGRRITPAPLTCPPTGRCAECMAWASCHLSSRPSQHRAVRWLGRSLRGRMNR